MQKTLFLSPNLLLITESIKTHKNLNLNLNLKLDLLADHGGTHTYNHCSQETHEPEASLALTKSSKTTLVTQ